MSIAENRSTQEVRRPRGFSPGATGKAGENATEQGWQLNEEERSKAAKSMQGKTGGHDYNYGAQDFGDTPEGMRPASRTNSPAQPKETPRMVSVKPRQRGRQG